MRHNIFRGYYISGEQKALLASRNVLEGLPFVTEFLF